MVIIASEIFLNIEYVTVFILLHESEMEFGIVDINTSLIKEVVMLIFKCVQKLVEM
jgi:hypothetical protein